MSRHSRLEWLSSRLRLDEPIILRDVAEELGVSLRTLSRDVSLLRERGVPVETDRGRGGGTRIASTWGVGRISLSHQEAVDVLIALATIKTTGPPITLGSASAVRTKLLASFSASDQQRIARLSERIKVGPFSSPDVVGSFRPLPSETRHRLNESFLLMRCAELDYVRADGQTSTRVVEPHYIVLNAPAWYVLCWDHLLSDVRTLRYDRVAGVRMLDATFRLKDWKIFETSMDGNELSEL